MASVAECTYGQACFNLACQKRHPTEQICSSPHTCDVYECNLRHSKERKRVCSKVSTPGGCTFGKKCIFLHPPAAVAPQNAAANAAINSTTVKLSGFASTAGIAQTEHLLTAHLLSACNIHAKVIVTITPSQPAFALLLCEDRATATTALHHFLASPQVAGLGNIQAQPHNPAAVQRAAVPLTGVTSGVNEQHNTPTGSTNIPNSRVQQRHTSPYNRPPQPNTQATQVTYDVLPGVAELLPNSPILRQEWQHVRMALEGHQQKIKDAKDKQQILLSNPSNLSNEDLRAAGEAIEQLLKELDAQRNAFVHYTNRILQRLPQEQQAAAVHRELYRLRGALPTLAARTQFENAVNSSQFIVVKGETGSGKSTQLPQYLADMGSLKGQVICTQPRKTAARALAVRVATEYAAGDERFGKSNGVVGYHVGGEPHFDQHRCRIKFMTEALFLSELLDQADLSRYAAVVVDEAHERSINTDVILGLLKSAAHKNPSLKIIVTSATIDTALFRDFFGQAACLDIPGRMFPVAVKYRAIPEADDLVRPVVGAVMSILVDTGSAAMIADATASRPTPNSLIDEEDGTEPQRSSLTSTLGGDVLVFLTGQDDVEKAKKALERRLEDVRRKPNMWPSLCNMQIRPMALYGQQDPKLVDAAICKGCPGERRVIFCTNVAETSLTIDGVTVVVDAGFNKEAVYDHCKHMTILQTARITQSSAQQRKGRAGRTAPGVCYRLYSTEDEMSMAPTQIAEVLRSPLELTVLNLKKLGIDAKTFNWLDKPDNNLLHNTVQQLVWLEALEIQDGQTVLTDFGRLVIELQMDPRDCKVLHYGNSQGMGLIAVKVVALLASGMRIFIFPKIADQQTKEQAKRAKDQLTMAQEGDIVTALRVFDTWSGIASGSGSSQPPSQRASADGANNLADDVSDTASDISGAYTASSTGVGPSRQHPHSASNWCRDHWVNNKVLGIADATRKDILRSLNKARFTLDCGHEDECTSEHVNKMFAAGYFQNFANQRQKGQYLAAGARQIGYVHNGSAFLYQASMWVAFQELFRSSRVFLMQVAPVKLEWLQELASVYTAERLTDMEVSYHSIYQTLMWQVGQAVEMASHTMRDLSRAMIAVVVGKQCCKLLAVERELQASLEVNLSQEVITVWALRANIGDAVQRMQAMMDKYKQTLLDETHEQQKIGSTRVLFGAGCTVKRLLLGKEFVRVNVQGLPQDVDANNLRQLLMDLCPECQGTAIQSISVEGQERSKNKWAHIQLEEPSQAAAVEAKLNDYVLNGKVLTAKPAGMHNVTQSNMMEARLNMFWHTGVSTGTGFVQFANAEAANDAIVYNAGHPLHGQVLQVKAAPDLQLAKQDKVKLEVAADGTYNGRVEGGRTGLALRFPVRITGLPKDADEITLRDHFQGFGNVASVSMCRKAAPASESDDDDNVMQIKLMSCAPQQSGRFAIVSQMSLPEKNFRSGQVVRYENVQQTEDAAAAFNRAARAEPKAYSFRGQPIRAQPDFTYTVSFHRAIFDSRPQDFAEVGRWCLAHGVRCVNKLLPGAQPRQLYRLTCSDKDYLMDARRQLDRLLRCLVFKHEHAGHLFSHYGRHRMQQLGQTASREGHATVHLHWDNSTRQIRLYGIQADKDWMENQLKALATELAGLQQYEYPIQGRHRRQCIQATPHWCSMEGVVNVRVMGQTVIATCTEQAAEQLRARIQQLTGPITTQQQQQHQPGECCICGDRCEQPFTLQGCGHKGCTDCLKPMFVSAANSETKFPLRCPCGVPVIMKDIISLSEPEDLEKIMMQSFASYKGNNLDIIFECQAVECQQVGCYPADLQGDPRWHCDVCLATYCLPCQKELHEPVLGHDGMSCHDFQQAVKAARESATYDLAQMGDRLLRCPGCAAYVEKSTGCLHMHCPRCDEHFCWGCGESFGKGAGHRSYAHIWGCRGPRAAG